MRIFRLRDTSDVVDVNNNRYYENQKKYLNGLNDIEIESQKMIFQTFFPGL